MAPLTVVFVCSGNTCRSPLLAALARSFWPTEAVFLSAGLQTLVGQPGTDDALEVAAERDLDLAKHRSRSVDDIPLEQTNWLIGMTRSHVAQLKARLDKTARNAERRPHIGLLGHANQDLSDRPIPMAEEVDDPYGAGLDAYRIAMEQFVRLLRSWEPTFTRQAKGDS